MIWFVLIAVPVALLGLVTVAAALVASQTDRSQPRQLPVPPARAEAMRHRNPEPDLRSI